MSKKAQGMSINIIIIAAIALLVLVILSIIFIGKMGKTREEVDKCETNGGTCTADCSAIGEYVRPVTSYKCYITSQARADETGKRIGESDPDLQCCIKV
jgi:flagellar basal body-associated protein FliL